MNENIHSHIILILDWFPFYRLLEEGDLLGAEKEKQRVEALQRERRKAREEQGISYEPRFFK